MSRPRIASAVPALSLLAGVCLSLAASSAACSGEQGWTSDPSWQGGDTNRTFYASNDDDAQTLVPAAKRDHAASRRAYSQPSPAE